MHPVVKSNAKYKAEDADVLLRPADHRQIHEDYCGYRFDSKDYGCVLACHSTALRELSSVFGDLFEVSEPNTNEESNGVPVIDVTEGFWVMSNLLDFVYDSEGIAKQLVDPHGEGTAALTDIYEAAHKYGANEIESLLEHIMLA